MGLGQISVTLCLGELADGATTLCLGELADGATNPPRLLVVPSYMSSHNPKYNQSILANKILWTLTQKTSQQIDMVV